MSRVDVSTWLVCVGLLPRRRVAALTFWATGAGGAVFLSISDFHTSKVQGCDTPYSDDRPDFIPLSHETPDHRPGPGIAAWSLSGSWRSLSYDGVDDLMTRLRRSFLALLFALAFGVAVQASTPPEFLLENLEPEPVIEYFMARYPQVQFWIRNPNVKNFYAMGTREEVLAIKRETFELDQAGKIPVIPESASVPLKHLRTKDALALLPYWVPGAIAKDWGKTISLEGPPKLRNQAGLALLEIDRPSVWIRLTREQLAQCPAGVCRLPDRSTNVSFECPKGDCGGLLHLTGLRQGDLIRWSSLSEPGKPFWVVLRNKAVTNIYLDFY